MSSVEVPALSIANLPTKLRRAIGLIAAYVLALQTILGSVAPRLTVAFDGALPFDVAAICLSSHGAGVGPAADIPGGSRDGSQAGDHCSLCISSGPPLLAPPKSIRIAIDFAISEPITPAAPDHLPSSNAVSRQGGARAPPTTA
jgi:hypothetical protein